MAKPIDHSDRFMDPFGEIVIERREIVARIQRDPSAEMSALTAAFAAIGEWLSQSWDGGSDAVSLEFRCDGRTFRAHVDAFGESKPIE